MCDRLKDYIFSIIKAKFIGVFSLLLWFSISALVTIVPIFTSIRFLEIEMSHAMRKPVNSLPTSDDLPSADTLNFQTVCTNVFPDLDTLMVFLKKFLKLIFLNKNWQMS